MNQPHLNLISDQEDLVDWKGTTNISTPMDMGVKGEGRKSHATISVFISDPVIVGLCTFTIINVPYGTPCTVLYCTDISPIM